MFLRLARALPRSLRDPLRQIRNWVVDFPLRRGTDRYCPVCQRSAGRFGRAGIVPRDDARCPWCGSLERHRLVWLYFTGQTDLFDRRPKHVLHVAPEPSFEKLLRHRLGSGYLTADLHNPRAMVRMDITAIQFSDRSFDVIYCSHVLEHVPDDRRAMREFYRVLKPGGWAVLLVPIIADQTDEDPSVTDPQERLRRFGQADHVRRYGPDFADRLREAGFAVRVVQPSDFLSEDEIARQGITPAAGAIYLCARS